MKLFKKLRSSRGESLTETLVAVLLLSLSTTMLVTMALAALQVNKKASEYTKVFYEQLTAAEAGPSDGNMQITIQFEDATQSVVPVFTYGQLDELRSYRKTEV